MLHSGNLRIIENQQNTELLAQINETLEAIYMFQVTKETTNQEFRLRCFRDTSPIEIFVGIGVCLVKNMVIGEIIMVC